MSADAAHGAGDGARRSVAPTRLTVLAPRMHTRGPLPKLIPVLLEALGRQGWEVQLLPWGKVAEGERLPAKLLSRFRDVVRARRAIVEGGSRMVLVNTGHDWLTLTRDLALTAALRDRRRAIALFFHGSQSPRLVAPGSWFFKRATRALISAVDGVLVLSHEERREWEAFRPGTRVFVVRYPMPNLPAPADDLGARPDRNGVPTVLCVSRLVEGKGVPELVRALAIVQRSTPCRLVVAGDGPLAGEIRALAQSLGVAVDMRGYLVGSELAEAYRDADVFALPTALAEGFPTVILEALAAGLPIVTTRSRGPADHLVEGEHALFASPTDPQAVAGRLVRLLTDEELRLRMGAANREKVRDFQPEVVAEEYVAALAAIAARGSREARSPSASDPRSR